MLGWDLRVSWGVVGKVLFVSKESDAAQSCPCWAVGRARPKEMCLLSPRTDNPLPTGEVRERRLEAAGAGTGPRSIPHRENDARSPPVLLIWGGANEADSSRLQPMFSRSRGSCFQTLTLLVEPLPSYSSPSSLAVINSPSSLLLFGSLSARPHSPSSSSSSWLLS